MTKHESRERAQIHAVKDMRALAHPTRLALLGALRIDGPQTGAMLGKRLGKSAGTVSYHLHALSKAGLVSSADSGSDGREHWWQAEHRSTHWQAPSPQDSSARASALSHLQKAVGYTYAEQWSRYVDSTRTLPQEWVQAAVTEDRLLRLTVEQFTQLGQEIAALHERWSQISDANESSDSNNSSHTNPGTESAHTEPVAVVIQSYRLT